MNSIMASKGTTNLFKEKKILQEEEKSLKSMLEKFQDQLNRLKIEELALSHLLRMQQSKEVQQGVNGTRQASSDGHNIASSNMFSDSEDGEESQLSDMIPVGTQETYLEGVEVPGDINRQVLDLTVPHSSGISHYVEGDADGAEEEEEEFDSDEMEDENSQAEDAADPLRTFMDDF